MANNNSMLSAELNRLILKLAPKHTALDVAPDTFEKLMSSKTQGLVVWSGASDATIYGDASVNHAFRAWHDSIHIAKSLPFTLEGETLVALEQARIIGGRYSDIIMAEIYGQAEYFQTHGEFPTNQVEFMIEYLKQKKVA